jgi:signal transduction histidine kinase
VNDPLVPVGVSRIVSEARRLSALVLELLDVSLLERGQLVTTREAVDLVDLAAAICARHTNARVQCRVSASDSVIAVADPIRMRQLMDHLIDNAIKFSPVGAEVTVRLWREGSEARVEVQDSGIGVPVQDLPRLFERFHRGSNVDDRRFAGLGLGLYLSRGIVEQHGGRIWAESNAGVGTTLSVALPINGPVTSASPVEFASGL